MQAELSRNKCRDKRIDVWPRAVDTSIFNPRWRSQDMRVRMSDRHPDDVILAYVGRIGAGMLCHEGDIQHDMCTCVSACLE